MSVNVLIVDVLSIKNQEDRYSRNNFRFCCLLHIVIQTVCKTEGKLNDQNFMDKKRTRKISEV